jgi:hypothetical protein
MTLHVRSADLDCAHEEILGVLDRNLPELPHARRFKWMYRDCHLGPAWSWLLWDSQRSEPVGVASVFRRAMWCGNRVAVCGQVGDFAIDPTHRSLGPAVMLQRATLEPVDAGRLAFCYDCPPNARGMSTFRRLRMTASATMARQVRLLRSDRHVGKYLGSGRATWAVAGLGNALIRLMSFRRRPPAGLEVCVHRGRFDEEFSRLDARVGGGDLVRSRRSADDLNWRYRDDPLQDYEVLTARRAGELLGFVVTTTVGRDSIVVDLFGVLSPDEAADLLEGAARIGRDGGLEALETWTSSDHPLASSLRRAGFRSRESGPDVVAYAGARPESARAWQLMYVDVMA